MSKFNIPTRLNDKARLLTLVGVMVLVAVAIAGVSIWTLYRVSLNAEKARLVGMAQAQVYLLEAVARFDLQFSTDDHPEGAKAATITQVLDAFQHYQGFGESGEFVLAERQGDEISFLASANRDGSNQDHAVLWNSALAEPMRRALLGESGTIIAPDYVGITVLAAYEPVTELDLGFVAKIDLAEVRKPFVDAAEVSALGGAVILLVGTLLFRFISLPIVQREEAEAAVRASEARLSGILDLAVDAVVSAGSDNRIQIFNGGAEVIFGYAADEVIGQRIGMLLPLRSQGAHEKHMADFDTSDRPRRMGAARSEIAGLRKDGTEFPAEASISRIEVGGEKLFTATLRDLTDQKEAEAALLREKAQAEEYLNIAGSMIMALDADGRITLMNEAARRTLEWEPGEAAGKKWYETFVPEEESVERSQWYLDWLAGSGRDVEANEVALVTRTGKHLLTRWNNRVIRDEAGNVVGALCSGEDITEHRQIEMQLRQAQKMEAVGQLTSGIAHDFNNILAVVLGNLEFAAERAGQGKDTGKQLELARQAAERGADLNRRLLAFSRGQVVESRPVYAGEVVEGMKDLLERALGEKIELVTDITGGLPQTVLDTAQLESAILNLAINARDAMLDGGIFGIQVFLADVPGPRGRDMVSIRAWDTGAGMTDDVKERAMEPFFTTKDVGHGSGLGLSMVYGFAEQSGGEMNIISEFGGGTIVEILLPVMEASERNSGVARTGDDMSPKDQGGTILVVEDQLEVREIVVANLESLGYRVLVAEDGKHALGILEAQDDIDLLLSDMVMPGMNGDEIVLAAREMNPGLRCLFMSGFPERRATRRKSSPTDIRILRKPFTKAMLAQTVQESLG